jgi:hypothetical protein
LQLFPCERIIYYLSFQNITFLINLMGELVYLLHNFVKQPPIRNLIRKIFIIFLRIYMSVSPDGWEDNCALRSLIKRLITFCMIILTASASAVFMISYVFFTDFNFHSAFITCNNLVLGNYFEIFSFTWRFVIGRIKILAA